MRRLIFIFWLAIFINLSQTSAQKNLLDSYIEEGLKTNLQLQQKQFDEKLALESLKEAKGLFLPKIQLLADYSYAQGGRKINLPVGDLLNPVYGTLNQLTQSQQFPQIANVKEQFLPNDFQDVRIRTSMPIVNASVWYNKKIQKAGVDAAEAQTQSYKRELIRQIKTAYYKHLQAVCVVQVYERAQSLLEENKRLNESLLNQQMALPSVLIQSESEILANKALLQEAKNNRHLSAAYFNFLLNRQRDEPIVCDTTLLYSTSATETPFANKGTREELLQLKAGIAQTRFNKNLKQAYLLPEINTFLDFGYQGFGFKYGSDQQYYLGGLNLKWNLFSGFQDRSKLRQSELSLNQIKLRYNEIERQFDLQELQARKSLENAQTKLEASLSNRKYREEIYRQVRKRYAQGQALSIELNDAFVQWINQETLVQTGYAELRIAEADLERVIQNKN